MNFITTEVAEAIKKANLCFIATVNEDNSPNLSPKASLAVWDENHVVFAHIASFKTILNLEIHCLYCMDASCNHKDDGKTLP